ncbi:hypothetical protein J2T13_004982 [Paenibacillus sp. DS2015]|uniref:hypothetical protein n=1 Tax=Paenibacillus sp. DS2015 TaxID=3373917 RepID=UPI003D1D9B85
MNTIIRPEFSVEFSPYVEVVCAIWRTIDSSDLRPGPRQPVIKKSIAIDFINQCIAVTEANSIREALEVRGLYYVLGIGISKPMRDFEKREELLYQLAQNLQSNTKVIDFLGSMYEKYKINSKKVLTLCEGSRYWEASLLSKMWKGELHLTVIPSIFMLPAPRGQTGYIREEENLHLTLVFGYTGPISDESSSRYRDWEQWFRFGVWHVVSRLYWSKKSMVSDQNPELYARAYSRLRPKYCQKADIAEFTLSTYNNWPSYAIEHLMCVTKLLCERELGGEKAFLEKNKWFYSLGRFHINWFLEYLQNQESIEALSFAPMCDRWIKQSEELMASDPQFIGPVGACENPIWSDQIKILFSPSISNSVRRAIKIWISNYWRIQPEVLELDPTHNDPNHSYLIFTLFDDVELLNKSDREWLENYYEHDGIVFVKRSKHSNQHWKRVSVCHHETNLLRLNQQVNFYADWTAIKEEQVMSGQYTFV